MIGFFDIGERNRSMGRLVSFMAACTGVATIICGIVLTFQKDTQGIKLIGYGFGILGSGVLLKFAQKTQEK